MSSIFDINGNYLMETIITDKVPAMSAMLDGYDCPAILVSAEYEILATNKLYQNTFGEIDLTQTNRCFQVSHGYQVPCDQAGEDCPLGAAKKSGHKERVLHIHQTPRGKEHVDVEMLPIHDSDGVLIYFVELLHPVPLASGEISDKELVGESKTFNDMLSTIARVGASDVSTLLLGESGTGKELAARAIHLAGKRNDQALVTLECTGLTDSLFESELFGHVKGAFTGAISNKKGLVELADGGTLFLDEIGDVPLSIQVKLLRLLETGTFRRVGSSETRVSDFRLICATHRNLMDMVEAGTFRADLFYRINVFPIHLPSLSERSEDIPILAKMLLKRIDPSREYQLAKLAISKLMKHHYKGNIRELRNILNRAVVLSDTEIIDEKVINDCFLDSQEYNIKSGRENFKALNDEVDLKTHEQRYIKQLLDQHAGDKERVATILKISSRSLYRKIADQEG
jgi:transcriptional regulator with PAS, ATPase and Fis domain